MRIVILRVNRKIYNCGKLMSREVATSSKGFNTGAVFRIPSHGGSAHHAHDGHVHKTKMQKAKDLCNGGMTLRTFGTESVKSH